MANKKLKVEVELDTAKAKRQAKELEATGSGGGASVATVAPAADRASRQIRDLGKAAEGTQVNMKAAGKAFAGMAVGMAASYAAKNMRPGAARTAVEYGSSAVSGAAMGMMFGPIGAAIGGLGGVLKTYLEKEGIKSKATEEFNRGEHDYASNKAFKEMIENLTEVGDHFENLTVNIEETKRQLEHYRQVEQELISKVRKFRDNGDEESAKIEEGYLSGNRSRQESLGSILKNLEKQQKALADRPEFRASLGGTDALQKIGMDGAGASDVIQAATSAAAAAPAKRRLAAIAGFSVPSKGFSEMSFGQPGTNTKTDEIARNTGASLQAQKDVAAQVNEIVRILSIGGTVQWQ